MPHSHDHIDGKCYPSVTEVIYSQPKPWLEKWKAKYGEARCDKKMQLANLIGTEFHRCCEIISQGKVPEPKCSRVVGMLKSFERDWFSVTAVAPYATEMKVYSHEYKYQGTLDLVAEIDGILTLVDYKSSAKINEDMSIQLSAYAEAYEEMTGVAVNQGLIVCVSKDKPLHKVTTKKFDLSIKKYFEKFLDLRQQMVEMPCPYKS